MELYAAYLEHYAAACDAHRQRVESPKRKFDMRFKPETKTSKELEGRGVAWCPNEICYAICILECVLSMDASNLFGYERLGFDESVPYGELSSDESGVDTSTTVKTSGTSTTAQQPQAKAPG